MNFVRKPKQICTYPLRELAVITYDTCLLPEVYPSFGLMHLRGQDDAFPAPCCIFLTGTAPLNLMLSRGRCHSYEQIDVQEIVLIRLVDFFKNKIHMSGKAVKYVDNEVSDL